MGSPAQRRGPGHLSSTPTKGTQCCSGMLVRHRAPLHLAVQKLLPTLGSHRGFLTVISCSWGFWCMLRALGVGTTPKLSKHEMLQGHVSKHGVILCVPALAPCSAPCTTMFMQVHASTLHNTLMPEGTDTSITVAVAVPKAQTLPFCCFLFVFHNVFPPIFAENIAAAKGGP